MAAIHYRPRLLRYYIASDWSYYCTLHRYVYDQSGRLIGDYGSGPGDVKGEFVWLHPEVAIENAFGGDDGAGGYAPLAVVTGPQGSAQVHWLHGDRLGKPVLTTDAAGAVVSTVQPYAVLGYPGQFRTFTDLWYNKHRDYDPTTGRYIQADPIGLAGDENPYAYARRNELRYVDPEGKLAWVVPVVIGAGLEFGH